MSTSADTATARSVVHAALTDRVRTRLTSRNSPVVALIDLDTTGASAIVVDITADDEIIAAPAPLTDVTPRALDLALAAHLIGVARVPAPDSDVGTAELRKLAGRARTRLAASEGAFIMGEEHVRLFRVTRRDMEVATATQAAELSAYIDDVLASVGAPDAAVLLTSTHVQWPGLDTLLSQVRGAPVMVLDDISDEPQPTHGVAFATTEDFLTPSDDQTSEVRVVEPPADAPTAVATASSSVAPEAADLGPHDDRPSDGLATVEPIGVDDAVTDQLEAITDRLDPVEALPGYLADADFDADTDLDADTDAATVVPPPEAGDSRWFSRQRWLLGGAVAGVLAVFGVATAVAFTGGSPEPATPSVAPSAPAVAAPPASSAPQEFADPSDLVEARRPAVLYTTPPPPPPPETSTQQQNQNPSSPRRQARPQPRIVIPIPGRPPIVIP
ncbi:hypothetical protein ABLE94_11980 [Gordonia sp. VNK1]|jgi:hypothetical protein|uniref:hypothetical protein n=1 Tax=Gordonia oleivorans TaxID=3156618 RepID=UPI0032B39117